MKYKFSFHTILIGFLSVMFTACAADYEGAENDKAALSDTTSITGASCDAVKLVKTAGISFKVKDVEKGTREVALLAKHYGGMLFSYKLDCAELGSNEMKLSDDSLMMVKVYSPQSSITARVPSQHLEQFMFEVAGIGYFTGSSNLNIDVKSLLYLRNALKQENRATALKQNAQQKKPVGTRGSIELKDEAIEQQIANRQIDADAQYSSVSLMLHQNPFVKKEVVANYNIADYELPFSTQFANALKQGWQLCLGFVLLIANLWFFILAAVVVMLIYRQYKRTIVVAKY